MNILTLRLYNTLESWFLSYTCTKTLRHTLTIIYTVSLHLPVQDSALPLANYHQKNGLELNLADPENRGHEH